MGRRKARAVPMALVTWTDAAMAVVPHWSDGDRPAIPQPRDYICASVGWLTHMDDHFVQLTQTFTKGQHANVVDIPRGMVREVKILTHMDAD
jgi:hypothetical protein